MKKIKTIGTLMCILFTACSCETNKKIVINFNNDEYVSHKDDEEEVKEGSTVDSSNIEGNSQLAYNSLCSLANKQLIDSKNLNTSLNYISGLSSIEYSSYKVTYCALGNKQDEYNYIVKVTMNHRFDSTDAFIYQMTNLKLNEAVTKFAVISEVFAIYTSEAINDKFDDLASTILPHYDASRVFTHTAYRAEGSSVVYLSVTYSGDDSQLHSINGMMYDDTLMDFIVEGIYDISPSTGKKMYDLIGLILE
ncbi:MAG: hypothetical protein J6T15_05940 [Bacilli bacterium]|nr:hypothetical protein [Bacilli bacterium]